VLSSVNRHGDGVSLPWSKVKLRPAGHGIPRGAASGAGRIRHRVCSACAV